jgi:hypothetical protein
VLEFFTHYNAVLLLRWLQMVMCGVVADPLAAGVEGGIRDPPRRDDQPIGRVPMKSFGEGARLDRDLREQRLDCIALQA